jgi:hypothetical protein
MVLDAVLPKDAYARWQERELSTGAKAIFAVPRINRHLASFAASEARALPSG